MPCFPGGPGGPRSERRRWIQRCSFITKAYRLVLEYPVSLGFERLEYQITLIGEQLVKTDSAYLDNWYVVCIDWRLCVTQQCCMVRVQHWNGCCHWDSVCRGRVKVFVAVVGVVSLGSRSSCTVVEEEEHWSDQRLVLFPGRHGSSLERSIPPAMDNETWSELSM